jgi:hypothetical protein
MGLTAPARALLNAFVPVTENEVSVVVDDRRPEQSTLRELFSTTERLIRELDEHLEQGFIPKAQQANDLVRPTPSGLPAANLEDITVRNHVAGILESENFTDQLYTNLERYFAAIDSSVSRIVGEQ